MPEDELRLELYNDFEVREGIQELFGNEKFVDGMAKFLPAELHQYLLSIKDEVRSIDDFQSKMTYAFLNYIKDISIDALSSSGLENLSPDKKYLFISNHRDIVLDSAYLNILLYEAGMTTSQIAIGDNLMKTRITELLFRINKSIVVKRTGSPRELYTHSMHLSAYIKRMINQNEDSIWLAQREGRAKDGNDITQKGVLKMISLSGGRNLEEHFQSLNIVPLSISYELDPTDLLKTKEYLRKLKDPNSKKTFQEDVNYMMQGMIGRKGTVHFNFGNILLQNDAKPNKNRKEHIESLANLIDESIHQNFKLHPINYVAHDILYPSNKFASHYSDDDWKKYHSYFDNQLSKLSKKELPHGQKYLLGIYANPVLNARLL